MKHPETLVVRMADGTRQRYKAAVFLINTKQNGVPRLCTMIPPDHTINLAGGEEFMVGYMPEKMLEPEVPT